jgi:hypothetical protein
MPKFVEFTTIGDESKVAIDVELISDLVPVTGPVPGTVIVLDGIEDVKVAAPIEGVEQLLDSEV